MAGQYKMQTANPGYKMLTRCKMQTADRLQNADRGFKLFFFYPKRDNIITYHLSRNRFSAIIFHDHLHYCRIFVSMKINNQL